MPELAEAAKKTNAWACYDCGKCTATCPISRAGDDYSPRRHVLATNLGHKEEMVANGSLFSCLTCSLCDQRCPAEVGYTELVQKLRELSYKEGVEPECPHGGALQSVMRMMARGGTQQDRMRWLTDELTTEAAKGEVFYWTGCTMYYDAFFSEFQVATLNGARYLEKEETLGTIEIGKIADLVVVDGDPASKIQDIRKIEIVFKDGIGYDSQKLFDSVKGTVGLR